MEITSENFDEVFPAIETAIKTCDFMAMDFELTGLYPRSSSAPSMLDTVQERYERAAEGSKTFIPIQFGLCTTKWNSEKESYQSQSFNFFIHPYVSKRGYQFCCDLSSLQFLSSNGFDFNKLFSKGLHFISQEKQQIIEEQNNETKTRSKIPLAPRDEEFLASSLEKVKEWLQTTEATLELPPCNSYLMRILFQEIPELYPGLTISQVSVEGQRIWKSMKFERLSEAERTQLADKELLDTKERMDKMAGFRRVVDVMCEVKKPLLGHNMLLDLCYFYNYFIGHLPEDVKEFKATLQEKFPVIIDTKFLAGEIESELTALGTLYEDLSKEEQPVIELEKGESEEDKAHEAGWDAYMTAHIFLKLCNSIDETTKHPISFTNDSPLSKLWNIVKIARLDANMELSRNQESDKAPENVFHVHHFDTKVKTSDIFNWFADYGKISVNWKDDNSAFVTINDPDKLEAAFAFAKELHHEFQIETLQKMRDSALKDKQMQGTPPRETLTNPPARTRRSSLKRTGKKRPRPSSIGFDDESTSDKKKQRTNQPEKTFECCIS